MKLHLWQVKHPYYAADAAYDASGTTTQGSFPTWQHFIAAVEADHEKTPHEYVLIRWDWQRDAPQSDDVYCRDGRLELFFVQQRKGRYCSVHVDVCCADEPAVVEWLKRRRKYLLDLWAPLDRTDT